MKKNIFVENYNNVNDIFFDANLDISDFVSVSYLDVLKEKTIEVKCKTIQKCKCTESVNFSTYYDKCDKCNGNGFLILNGNKVVCNKCRGKKMIVKNKCPLCDGEGLVEKKGFVSISLNRELKDGDLITIEGKGKDLNGIKGNLLLKIDIKDKECFDIKGNDVYDKRVIKFSKEDVSRGISKQVETIKGFNKVKPSYNDEYETFEFKDEGIDGGSFFVCTRSDLAPIKGKDIYKNVVINRNESSFYINREELSQDNKCLTVYYYKPLNDDIEYDYLEINDANNFKVVKLKEKGIEGRNGGVNGDLYLKIFFDDEFIAYKDEIHSLPIKLNKGDLREGRKIIDYGKNKITLTFEKGLKEEKNIEINEYGCLTDKNGVNSLIFTVSPYAENVYKISVKKSNKKEMFVKDYKKYFFEEVQESAHGLRIILKKKEQTLYDDEGNRIIVRVIK